MGVRFDLAFSDIVTIAAGIGLECCSVHGAILRQLLKH
jgi:hypothetical protein